MFEALQERFGKVIKNLTGKGRLTEKNIADAVRQVKLSLLEADVNYKVVKDFIERVKSRVLGEEVLKSFTPEQQFIAAIRDELIGLLGGEQRRLNLVHRPSYIMLVGLQGSGKTTTAAKLAKKLKKEGLRPLLVAADVYRPAAIDQLEQLGKVIEVPVVTGDRKNPEKIVKEAQEIAVNRNHEVVILDTAGRLHIDDEMMEELSRVKELVRPDEILMVVDAMAGQDAVNSAKVFDERLDLTGFIVTKMDGDARGGVILSIHYVTGKPIKFVGVGEKIDDLEPFYPDRVASRILGMGDVLSLIDKLEASMDAEKMKEMESKLKRLEFDLNDFREQLIQLKKMGSLAEVMSMIPGAPSVDAVKGEENMKKALAILDSMTPQERRNPRIINHSRKLRIAKGSGTTVNDVNRLLKNYEEFQKMMKQFKSNRRLLRKFGLNI
ncbi:MAG: signal recognition particle subunit [Thermotogota bacterium]|nr:signal recognition particle subunit [Thermotogota bacterium]MDK2864554.1 signal recognition particle subunit [Thermotogota bacterium]HCZ06321.1 signal recognition particle protein [Thermotogota bacterium]